MTKFLTTDLETLNLSEGFIWFDGYPTAIIRNFWGFPYRNDDPEYRRIVTFLLPYDILARHPWYSASMEGFMSLWLDRRSFDYSTIITLIKAWQMLYFERPRHEPTIEKAKQIATKLSSLQNLPLLYTGFFTDNRKDDANKLSINSYCMRTDSHLYYLGQLPNIYYFQAKTPETICHYFNKLGSHYCWRVQAYDQKNYEPISDENAQFAWIRKELTFDDGFFPENDDFFCNNPLEIGTEVNRLATRYIVLEYIETATCQVHKSYLLPLTSVEFLSDKQTLEGELLTFLNGSIWGWTEKQRPVSYFLSEDILRIYDLNKHDNTDSWDEETYRQKLEDVFMPRVLYCQKGGFDQETLEAITQTHDAIQGRVYSCYKHPLLSTFVDEEPLENVVIEKERNEHDPRYIGTKDDESLVRQGIPFVECGGYFWDAEKTNHSPRYFELWKLNTRKLVIDTSVFDQFFSDF